MVAFEALGDGAAEVRLPLVVGVAGATPAERVLRCGDDVARRRRVRLTAHQRYQRPPLRLERASLLQDAVYRCRPQLLKATRHTLRVHVHVPAPHRGVP